MYREKISHFPINIFSDILIRFWNHPDIRAMLKNVSADRSELTQLLNIALEFVRTHPNFRKSEFKLNPTEVRDYVLLVALGKVLVDAETGVGNYSFEPVQQTKLTFEARRSWRISVTAECLVVPKPGHTFSGDMAFCFETGGNEVFAVHGDGATFFPELIARVPDTIREICSYIEPKTGQTVFRPDVHWAYTVSRLLGNATQRFPSFQTSDAFEAEISKWTEKIRVQTTNDQSFGVVQLAKSLNKALWECYQTLGMTEHNWHLYPNGVISIGRIFYNSSLNYSSSELSWHEWYCSGDVSLSSCIYSSDNEKFVRRNDYDLVLLLDRLRRMVGPYFTLNLESPEVIAKLRRPLVGNIPMPPDLYLQCIAEITNSPDWRRLTQITFGEAASPLSFYGPHTTSGIATASNTNIALYSDGARSSSLPGCDQVTADSQDLLAERMSHSPALYFYLQAVLHLLHPENVTKDWRPDDRSITIIRQRKIKRTDL